jgi:hypothetical protein
MGSASWIPNPAFAGYDRRNLALTEEAEVEGNGSFTLTLTLIYNGPGVSGAPEPPGEPAGLQVTGPLPSPSRGTAELRIVLPEPGPVRYDVVDLAGRLVGGRDLGTQAQGEIRFVLEPVDAGGMPLRSGLYLIHIVNGSKNANRRWLLIR